MSVHFIKESMSIFSLYFLWVFVCAFSLKESMEIFSIHFLWGSNQDYWKERGRHQDMRLTSEAVHKFLKAQNGSFSALSKLMRRLVKRHVVECEYSKSAFKALRDSTDIKLLLKTSQKATATRKKGKYLVKVNFEYFEYNSDQRIVCRNYEDVQAGVKEGYNGQQMLDLQAYWLGLISAPRDQLVGMTPYTLMQVRYVWHS